jgi:hypothetical protein
LNFKLQLIRYYYLISIILRSNRLGDKVLKGLQGTATTTIIGRGAYDAYKSLTDGDNSSEDSSKKDNKSDDNNKSDNSKDNNKNESGKDNSSSPGENK